jgi:hypothetical protein
VGGLDVPAAEDPNTGQPGSDAIVIANAAIIVCFEE